DSLGDMDFKVAGTKEGIVALQMDMKIAGVSSDILRNALEEARKARMTILDKIESVISEPKAEMSPHAPRIMTIKIPTEKIREVIGPGGKVVQGIIAETGATIDIEDDGTIFVASKSGAGGEKAKHIIESIVKDVEKDDVFVGRVTKTTAFGAFVELKPGREGLVHISKLAKHRVGKVEDVVNEGDQITVKVLEIDRQNRVSLTAIDVEEPTN
ncbi:MAG: S1 RNA-binding domain-containing protein, partial [Actinomycetia bacterium]|nr:S1 RNA-binding domain-containing protein [Actinomycetes bacterium]